MARGPFEAEKPLYTNVVSGVETWYEVSAPGCDPVTNVATVTVTPRNLASAVLSSVRFESVEGVRTPVVELVDDLGHEIDKSGYELGMSEAQNGETLLTFSGRGNYCGLLEKSIAKTSFRVTSDAEGDIRLSDYSGVYDGGGHGIGIETKDIPGLVLRYATASGGVFSAEAPVFTNAGVATVWVEATAPGYFATTCTVTVAISKATYDMDGAAWDYTGPFSYDKSEKSVSVTGLPSGVSVESYSGGAATVPGAYTAHATLAYDTKNYDAPTIPDLEWKIVFDAGPKLVEAFGGVDASVARDSAGLWCVTLTNDVFLTSGPIEIPDNLGLVTLDLNGHEITGAEGQPALRIVPGGDAAGDSTFLAIVSAGGDNLRTRFAGCKRE